MDRFLFRLSEPEVRDYLQNLGLRAWFERDGGDKANPDPDEIEAAEEALGFKLPPGYRTLLRDGKPEDMPCDVYWIGDPSQVAGDLVAVNQDGTLPSFLIGVVDGGGNGDQYCFDLRHPREDGEYPIVLWDHEVHDSETPETAEFVRSAEDLGEFLLASLP